MASKHGSQYVSLLLVGSQSFQLFRGAATAVIEQDGRKWAATLGPVEQRVECNRPVLYYDGSWIAAQCPLCGERRSYLPSEIFRGRLSYKLGPGPVRTGVL